MLDQINAIVPQGYKPVLYIDTLLAKSDEMIELSRAFKKLNIPIYYENNTIGLDSTRKAYVFRYGYLPSYTLAAIIRKGGKVVSGNLQVA